MNNPINGSPAYHTCDTIAAVSTPPGEGGIGVIRLSGPDAIPLALRLFRRKRGAALAVPRPFRQYYGHIVHPDNGTIIDEVLLAVMRAPRSYTCEDMAEISAHGGSASLRAILHLVCAAGARLAHPGEFTQRAFLNGRLDLTQAEAVLDTIRARTDAGLRAAQQRLAGTLGTRIAALRARLITLLASLEVALDYADEDLTFLTPAEIADALTALRGDVAALLASYTRGRILRDGASTAILGRTNTGKSSLLNALVGEARAIVTAIPGTTRDLIEEQLDLDGVPLRLVDTAGIRDTQDPVERIGVERSHATRAQADLVLLVLDRAQPLTPDDHALLALVAEQPVIIVLNKSDLPAVTTPDTISALRGDVPVLEISAATGAGLDALRAAIREQVLGEVTSETPMLASARQREAAERADAALAQASAILAAGGTEELIAVDVMAAATALGEITGDTVGDAVIQEIFARFCLGK